MAGQWTDLFDGRSLTGWGWRQRVDGRVEATSAHTWSVVGGVQASGERLFVPQPGTGVLLNSPDGKTADIHTLAEHGSCELHLEFCIPARSNSGVYLQGQYEIQIVDSHGLPDAELKYGSCGGVYARWIAETQTPYDGHPPRTNACRPAGAWQSLEVLFHAPRFDAEGRKSADARFERITLNGVTIHENVTCTGPTRGSWLPDDVARGPLRLQGDHGPVAFRGLRMRPLE